MVQYIITPWRDRGELHHVRRSLYAEKGSKLKDDDRTYAVAKVSVWMQRGNCPHLVESTAILTSAILNDVPSNSTYCVRAAYSAAFCRFVTGLLDSHQDRRRKLSMYSIAKTIGLPATYVELRHQATHEELPSLSKLRTAAEKALRWIWDYYWSKLSFEASSGNDCKSLVRKLVEEHDEAFRQKMELSLSSWDADQILDVLVEVQSETEDATLLLRALHFQNRIMARVAHGNYNDDNLSAGSTVNDIETVREELARMENKLSEMKDDEHDINLLPKDMGADSSEGWVLWEGPWVSKPIGVV